MFQKERMRIMGVLFFSTILSLLAASCSEDKSTPTPEAPPPPTAGQPGAIGILVTIPADASTLTTDAFGVNPLTITIGTTVTWLNNDSVAHTATSINGVWDSGTINPGQSFSFLFSSEGTFHYACSIHPNMSGTVVVTDE